MPPELKEITTARAATFARIVKHEDKMLNIISTLRDVPPQFGVTEAMCASSRTLRQKETLCERQRLLTRV